jgi:hypothetical protein
MTNDELATKELNEFIKQEAAKDWLSGARPGQLDGNPESRKESAARWEKVKAIKKKYGIEQGRRQNAERRLFQYRAGGQYLK